MINEDKTYFYFAPLEGITGYIYRNAFHETFGAADKYFIPFISPGAKKKLTEKEKNDILPEHNKGMYAVPQIMSKNVTDVINACKMLKDMGYEEVNINIGCPSGTVVSKGRGAGLLEDPLFLNRFLEEIFSKSELPVSVKTRIGLELESEWEDILKVYNQYPLKELIIHPRLRKDFYNGIPNYEAFAYANEYSKNPLCYNGDINTLKDYEEMKSRFPKVNTWMIGRGFLRNPYLLKQLHCFEEMREVSLETDSKDKGLQEIPFVEKSYDYTLLKQFHDTLLIRYKEHLPGEIPVLFKMKELWFYMRDLFPKNEKLYKNIKKTKHLWEYESIVKSIF